MGNINCRGGSVSHANFEADLSPLTRFDAGFTAWHRYTVSSQFYMRHSCTVDLLRFVPRKREAGAAGAQWSTRVFGNTVSSFGKGNSERQDGGFVIT